MVPYDDATARAGPAVVNERAAAHGHTVGADGKKLGGKRLHRLVDELESGAHERLEIEDRAEAPRHVLHHVAIFVPPPVVEPVDEGLHAIAARIEQHQQDKNDDP